jgi:hypothetical protein
MSTHVGKDPDFFCEIAFSLFTSHAQPIIIAGTEFPICLFFNSNAVREAPFLCFAGRLK